MRRGTRRALCVWAASAVIGLSAGKVAAGVNETPLDREFRFASGLVEMGFPDLAEKVVGRILKKHPDQKDRAKLINAEILISQRKFDEVEKLLKGLPPDAPKTQAIRLALANAYYRFGDVDKAKAGYEAFFHQYRGKVPTDPDLRRFYQESAYRFAQMLKKAGDFEGAVKAYSRLLATRPDKALARRLMTEEAELYVKLAEKATGENRKRWLEEASRLCEQVQWGGLDIWFGQSIITMAHIEMVRGANGAARKVLKSNMDIFKEINDYMKERGLPLRESPMAGARFLLGKLYEEQGRHLLNSRAKSDEAVKVLVKALREFYNVFAKYGDSDWGREAGVRAKAIKELLESLGKTVKVDLGAHAAQAAATEFRLGDDLFRDRHYHEAADEYVRVLNRYPEGGEAVKALGRLGLCYANLGDDLSVKMVVNYLGERFARNADAPTGLLGVGKWYFDHGRTNMFLYVYDRYLEYFPRHDRAPAVMYTLGGLLRKAGDKKRARQYFDRILKDYPHSSYYLKTLQRQAWDYYEAGQYEKAAGMFARYVAASQPGHSKAQAEYSLADCYLKQKKYAAALKEFEKLIVWLAPSDSAYNAVAGEAVKNRKLLERAAFFRGFCLARVAAPKEKVKAYRIKSVKAFKQFLALFPKSELAPKAMSSLGTVELDLGLFDQATKTFERLAQKYPNSPEGRSALFALIRAAMEVGRHEIAKDALNKMLASASAYTAQDFAWVGQMMLDAGLYDYALKSFNKAYHLGGERAAVERSLFGMGKAAFELKQYDQAVKYLEELLTRYPHSALFYQSKLILGKAYRALGRLDDAVGALRDVFRFADNNVLINRANLMYGQIKEEQEQPKAALASYQRIALLADPNDPELRPMIKDALWRSIQLGMKIGLYDDVMDSCDQYLKLFSESERISEVRDIKAQARLKAAAAHAAEAAAAAAEGASPETSSAEKK